MLTLNSTNRVTFDVNVHGTSSTPTVRCVVGETPGLTYPAVKLQDGKYEVLIDLPTTMGEGSQLLKVEVLLNGRLFTPISTQIAVGNATAAEAPVEAPVEIPKAAPETPKIIPVEMPRVVPVQETPKVAPAKVAPAKVAPAKVAPAKVVSPSIMKQASQVAETTLPAKSIPRSIPKSTRTLSALESVLKSPVKKLRNRETQVSVSAPTKISIASIANEATELEKPYEATTSPVVEQITSSIPITLIKGDIIYK